VSPLKNLGPQPDGKKGLQTLYLDNQSDEKEKKPLSDISSLKGLTGLNHLHLNYNNIKNINVIVHLINLIHLDISQNPIQNFMPLVVNSDKGGLGADSIVWMHDVPKDKPFYSYAVKFLEDNRVTVYKN
jgi:Leucine-rich repeat (LRR) protein